MSYTGCNPVTIPKVLITGLGQLGLAAAKYVKERGFDTYGYDINTEAMEIAHRSAGIKQVTDFGGHDFDVYIICVSTHRRDDIFSPHHPSFYSDIEQFKEVLTESEGRHPLVYMHLKLQQQKISLFL